MSVQGDHIIRSVERSAGHRNEAMGTKAKFWYPEENGDVWLFKFARTNTGEHWSEKIAAEIGEALGIPCARVDLATCDGSPGTVSKSFVGEGSLVHGNELLQEVDESYPMVQLRGVSKHTVDAVLGRLEGVLPPQSGGANFASAADWFVGYLLLDALIVNSDRHHENWGVLQFPDAVRRLAPSYDHASSLGRELTDTKRERRLQTLDPAFTVAHYVQRARSGLYAKVGDKRPLHPAEVVRLAAKRRPQAMAYWIERLHRMSEEDFERIVARLPSPAISAVSRAFVLAVLRVTRQNLLSASR